MKFKYLSAILPIMASAIATYAANPIAQLLERIDSGASEKFEIVLEPGEQNFFCLDQNGDKPVIKGNNYVNIATGLNWYLKHHAGIHLSWNGMKAALPDILPPVAKAERHETNLKKRYDLNYCTFSYSMPFWDWERWQQEIDWMALHGINMPLAMVGLECVWRNMLLRLGYSEQEISEFIAGPAFLAWWAMNNLEGWGGPNPSAWYARQEDLQKKILARMAEYGMHPVLPGYSGMMPHNADEKLGIDITKSGSTWCGYQRPAFLQPTDKHFAEYAQLFYDEQAKLFGIADYYSMDPFHESDGVTDFDFGVAGNEIMKAMKKTNPDAQWVIQAWNENPREDMIKALAAGDAVILDLYSECMPKWGMPSPWKRDNGYYDHQWIFCMLENFGGNVGLHGRIDALIHNFYLAKSHPMAKHLVGYGFTMEGIENNPMIYELMSELPWIAEKPDKEEWIDSYIQARYGQTDDNAKEAWHLLCNSIYNCPGDSKQQGTTESIFCARPSLNAYQASSWSNMSDYYDAADTQQAARLMLEAAPKYKGNNNYEYDLIDIVRQAIADKARQTYGEVAQAYLRHDKPTFKAKSQEFLDMIMLQDSLLGLRPEFQVGRWLQYARNAGSADSEKDLYEWNARVQLTTWGNRKAAEDGRLKDYAHKEWSGMLRDVYYPRWEAFFDNMESALDKHAEIEPIDFYSMDEAWTLDHNSYAVSSADNVAETVKAIFTQIFD